MTKIKVRNRLWPTDNIAKASIAFYPRQPLGANSGGFGRNPFGGDTGGLGLKPPFLKLNGGLGLFDAGCVLRQSALLPVVSFQTNSHGVADLNVKGIADGAYLCSVMPHDVLFDAVGPATASDAKPPTGIYRTLSFDVMVRAGTVTLKSPVTAPSGTAIQGTNEIIAGLQPVWMKSPQHSSRGGTAISLIVVHHTAVNTRGSIQTFMSEPDKSVHYMIDTDGQVVKFVQESQKAFHAGFSHWAGESDINRSSIGIEIVNTTGPYPEAQYSALIELIGRLLTANPQITPDSIVGHSDIGTTKGGGTKLGRKSSDPGMQFQWSRLENRGWGLLRTGGQAAKMYGGFFDAVPAGSLRHGDSDKKHRFGGTVHHAMKTTPVKELQDDLTGIGYSLGSPDGEYDGETEAAVKIFQEHFFAGGGGRSPDGRVDAETARLIKSVAGAPVPQAAGATP
jgi:N-acetylmuramoyl-L-alanine amidase